ncbi:hypothetical protein MWU65_10700 [Cellulophaga sp. F20128]|uniref:hypothetical protein n=1 Tax=Cellulophaga sp. F20128 TaxID=2926413 RepID=UPI001FF48231|nr:hypothetical protein [Cellulophaga sp. F20128]MCK0157651.1 hypothetical protein [Cellulophaga sp. F20128]
MKKIYFIPIFFLLSCSPLKIQVNEMNTGKGLKGKVKMLEITSSRFKINGEGTSEIKELKTQSTIILNDENKISKKIDEYYNGLNVTNFNYADNLLISLVSEINGRIDRTEYKYDSRGTIIEYKDFENDTLKFYKTYKYDSRSNPVEIRSIFNVSTEDEKSEILKNVYNYKDRTYRQYSINNEYGSNDYFKTYYNKKGLEIKGESIDSENKITSSVTYDYDEEGNLIKQINYNQNQQPTQINYKYIYDNYGNATMIKEFTEDKMISLTYIKITY